MIPGIVAGRRQSAGPPPTDDPLWASVRSLLHFDGVDGATAIVDQKGVSWTRAGVPVLSDDQVVFGPTSLRLPNATGNDDFNAASDLIVASGSPSTQLTIEGWIYVETLTGFQYGYNPLVGQGASSGSSDQFFGLANGKVNYYRAPNAGSGAVDLLGTTVVAINTWHHVAMTYDGTTIRVFLDGVLEGSVASSRGWVNTGQRVRVGRQVVSGYEAYHFGTVGYIDEVRITRACRYTATFTPVGPFPNSGP